MEDKEKPKDLDDILNSMRQDKNPGSQWASAIALSLMLKGLLENEDDRFIEAIDLIIEACKIQIQSGNYQMIEMMFGDKGFEPILNQVVQILDLMQDHARLVKAYEILGWQSVQQNRGNVFSQYASKICKKQVIIGEYEEAIRKYTEMIKGYKEGRDHFWAMDALLGMAKAQDYSGDLIQAEKYYSEAVEYARINRSKPVFKKVQEEYENFKKKRHLLELGAKWKLNSNISNATIEISIDKGNNWITIPLNPNQEQLAEAMDEISIIYNVKKAKNIRFFFHGQDASGNVIKDDNNGQYYIGFA